MQKARAVMGGDSHPFLRYETPTCRNPMPLYWHCLYEVVSMQGRRKQWSVACAHPKMLQSRRLTQRQGDRENARKDRRPRKASITCMLSLVQAISTSLNQLLPTSHSLEVS